MSSLYVMQLYKKRKAKILTGKKQNHSSGKYNFKPIAIKSDVKCSYTVHSPLIKNPTVSGQN